MFVPVCSLWSTRTSGIPPSRRPVVPSFCHSLQALTKHDPRTDPDVPAGMSIELLQDLHLLTRDGQLNADARRKLKQIRHLLNLLKPALDDALARAPRTRSSSIAARARATSAR